jgi:hypothetical protein
LPPPVPKYKIAEIWEDGKSQEVISVEKKKMGRPTDSPKTYRESFRLSESDMAKINFCINKTGMSKTDVIRRGIDKVYEGVLFNSVLRHARS